jgi:enolase-phosphatase E1
MDQVRGILLDIEGTTTPIAFVHEVLFSYARTHARDFLRDNQDSE